jgi:hypothetical protein
MASLLKRRRSPWFWSDYLDHTRLERERNLNANSRHGHSPAHIKVTWYRQLGTSRPRILRTWHESG